MLNKKGQALIEFVLVLPIVIMLLFAMIDIGNMYMTKANLESTLNTAVELYKEDSRVEHISDVINKNNDNNIAVFMEDLNDGYAKLSLRRNVDLITPGFNLIFGDPYQIEAERVIKK